MITTDGWFDWAVRVPGPSDKRELVVNSCDFIVFHSAVGYYQGWTSRLFSRARQPNGSYTKYAAASVHGWNPYDGKLIQHYPLTTSCWGNGSFTANTRGLCFEQEGGAPGNVSEPVTAQQLATMQRITREVDAWAGWSERRRPVGPDDLNAQLYEHNECVRFGSDATACPSGRIPWQLLLREEDDNMGIIVREWSSHRHFLWIGTKLYHIPTQGVHDNLENTIPTLDADEETWNWITSNFELVL